MATNLSLRQQRAAENYVLLGNKAEAMRRAGYAESTTRTATKLFARPEMVSLVERLKGEHAIAPRTRQELARMARRVRNDADKLVKNLEQALIASE